MEEPKAPVESALADIHYALLIRQQK